MKNRITTSAILALLLAAPLAAAAHAEDPQKTHTETSSKRDANGNVQTEVKTNTTDADGTVTTNVVKENIDTNRVGRKRARLSHTVTRDPKGLMNKTSDTTESNAEYKPNGTLEKKSTSDRIDAAGTRHTVTSTTSTAAMPGGGRRTVMKEKEVEDPKGLMNKHTVSKTTTVNTGIDGRPTVTQQKDIDGKEVERTVTEPAVQ